VNFTEYLAANNLDNHADQEQLMEAIKKNISADEYIFTQSWPEDMATIDKNKIYQYFYNYNNFQKLTINKTKLIEHIDPLEFPQKKDFIKEINALRTDYNYQNFKKTLKTLVENIALYNKDGTSSSAFKIFLDFDLKKQLLNLLPSISEISVKKGPKTKDNSSLNSFIDFNESLENLITKQQNSTKYLAIKKGKRIEELDYTFNINKSKVISLIKEKFPKDSEEVIEECFKKYYQIFLQEQSEKIALNKAQSVSTVLFQKNLKNLLKIPPLGNKVTMGIKALSHKEDAQIAIVDQNGEVIEFSQFNIFNKEKKELATAIFLALIQKHKVLAIAIGNSVKNSLTVKNIELFSRNTTKDLKLDVLTIKIDDYGSSQYAKSKISEWELPERTNREKEATFIARRLQDPISEFAKIKLSTLGVGQYQSEVDNKTLETELNKVLIQSAHEIRPNLNYSSASLIEKISGLDINIAKKIIDYRKHKSGINSKLELTKNKIITEQQAKSSFPFLRVGKIRNDIESISIPYEIYVKLKSFEDKKKTRIRDIAKEMKLESVMQNIADLSDQDKSKVIQLLKSSDQDTRLEFEAPEFRSDIKTSSDLKVGTIYPGIISNITTFGLFIDVGIGADGLVPISQIKIPWESSLNDFFQPTQKVSVKVNKVDIEKERISYILIKPIDHLPKITPRPSRQNKPYNKNKGNFQKNSKRKPISKKLTDNPFAALENLMKK